MTRSHGRRTEMNRPKTLTRARFRIIRANGKVEQHILIFDSAELHSLKVNVLVELHRGDRLEHDGFVVCRMANNGQPVTLKMLDPLAFCRDMVRLQRPLRLLGRWRRPKDGLYRVATRRTVHGGFLVQRGRVTRCSPAVRKRIHIWARTAEYYGDIA
jgi:hypothetical protein